MQLPPTRATEDTAAKSDTYSRAINKAAAEVPIRARRSFIQRRAERATARTLVRRTADKSATEQPAASRALSSFTIREAAADVPPDVRRGIVHSRAERATQGAIITITADKSRAENRPQAGHLIPLQQERQQPMFQFVHDEVTSMFEQNAPHLVPLPQLPPTRARQDNRPQTGHLIPLLFIKIF